MRSAMDLLLLIVTLLCQRLGLNSHNRSIPPSSDQNRKKNSKGNSTKKSGGQKGHKGITLPLDDNPDITHKLIVDSKFYHPVTIPIWVKRCGKWSILSLSVSLLNIAHKYLIMS
jgi:hypothetical protein